ncbi:MAG: DUF3160 domain-containing protein [Ignavibacterium sp.]|jgi:hypothetical protein|uniref:DUF3160 domain-containing protein n=1 Tax=Ignavibacterium sp. TaxID=2651167 RepID=UPI0032982F41
MKKLKFNASLLFVFSFLLYGQSNFNIEAYRQYLQSHQNLSTEGLLSMYPSGGFLANINTSFNDARLFSRIDSFYSLTNFEKELINKHGFMVSERLKKTSFGQSLLEIFHSDIPVFVSVDAILHAFHISYDRILMDVEIGLLIGKLNQLLQNLHSNQNLLAVKYASYPEMQIMLKDVDVYLTVARRLMNSNVYPHYPQNAAKVNEILNLISNEQPSEFNLFSDNCRIIDWSQFKPRGHYANNQTFPELAHYFRTMMWLGRIELYLLQPTGVDTLTCFPSISDIQRQTIDALLISELIFLTNSKTIYDEIETAIRIFAGDQDNVTLDNLSYLKTATSITDADELLNFSKLIEFQDTLRNQSFAHQLILSQILINNPLSPDSISPASSFLLFGQRFVIDSYVTASVVFDRIRYFNQVICRLYPSTLDVLFSLGNDAAAQLLINELNQYHYSSNLAALRYLIDSYDNDFWTANLYSNWLKMIRELNPPSDRSNLPQFMQTAAYWQQKMNSQLSSWTELRHDNLLYAKQSYTGGTICSFPYSYVEPFPNFYSTLKEFAINAKEKITSLNFSNNAIKSIIISYLDHLFSTSDTLQTISSKELDNIMFTQNEISFLQRMIYETGNSSGEQFDGWYPKLFYRDFEYQDKGLMESDHIVADIHTTPTDCNGLMGGWISHVGNGNLNVGVFITPWVDGELTAFAGPVMSYHEYRSDNFLRLTDDEWNNTYLQSALRPSWVNLYLADSTGNSRGNGPKLLTSEKDDFNNSIVDDYEIKIANFPNPFNSSTLIVFTVPVSLTNQNVNLRIFDLNGNLVSELVNQTLSSGNYIYRWEAKNSAGQNVASGIYFYNIQIADRTKTGKMLLIK